MRSIIPPLLILSIFGVSLHALRPPPTNLTKPPLHFPDLQGPLITTDNSTINIRIVPHTHDDVGWLKTVDQYYYGSERQINNMGVQYILDNVIPLLTLDPSKKFIYVEIGFFQRWWDEQDDIMKAAVKLLVKKGQLEFINGGVSMNDEGDVYYEDTIDQMTVGHQFLLQNFGVTPTVGWHIDCFGHAAAQAALFAQMGFSSFFFARIDYQDKTNRLNNKDMEMLWIPQTSQGIENAMFTHVNYMHYSNPAGFNFDVVGGDQPIMDDPRLEEYNVPQRADAFVAYFRQMQADYRTTELMHTAGDDFHYMLASMNYKNYNKLFKYIKSVSSYNVNTMFSTVSEYVTAINSHNVNYTLKTDDFFPYAHQDDSYWTGYFSSRVALKGYVRKTGRFLQALKRLATQVTWQKTSAYVLKNFAAVDSAILELENAMGILQHHDAVTGTETEDVTTDYKGYLGRGIASVQQSFVFPYFQEKIQSDLGIAGAQVSMCQLNTSAVFCNVTYQNLGKGSPVLAAIYNSGTARKSTIRIKVPNGNVQVENSKGAALPTDIICSNSTDATDCDLFFTDQFAAFTTAYYYLVHSATSNQITPQSFSAGATYPVNSNQTITTVDMVTFALNYCQNEQHTICYKTQFNIDYKYYESYQASGQVSNPWIFRPSDKTKTAPLSYSTAQSASIYQGKNLLQIHIKGSRTITDIRIYNDLNNGIEASSFIDSIPMDDNQGKEVVMLVNVPSIKNNNTFYTDSMGMELQKRILNYRPTWNLQNTQPVSGNYYPIQSTILINDTSSGETLVVIPDRSQGGSSINQGQVELMIHRRFPGLNEVDWDGQGMRQWATYNILFSKPGSVDPNYRNVQLNGDVDNLVILAPTPKTPLFFQENFNELSFGDVDRQVKILARPMSTTKFLLRFHNMDENVTKNVSTSVFTNANYAATKVVETSLTANQAKSDMIKKRLNWNGLQLNNPAFAKTDYLTSSQFSLRPLEIRTFTVDLQGIEEIISI